MYRPRRLGESPNYTPEGTARYFSQKLRWLRGQSIGPDQSYALSPTATVFRFRTGRATDGFHEVLRVRRPPDGGSLEQGGDPDGGSCPPNGTCLTNLHYVRVRITGTMTAFTRWFYRGPGELPPTPMRSGWFGVTQPVNQDYYVRLPGSSRVPPADGKPRQFVTYLNQFDESKAGCPYSLEQSTFTIDRTTSHRFAVWYYGSLALLAQADSTTRDPIVDNVVCISGPNESDPCGNYLVSPLSQTFGESSLSIALEYFYSDDREGPLSSFRCGDDPDGDDDDEDEPRFDYFCNCPDFSQKQGHLPGSPYPSEWSDRSWVGSNSHSGTCKHIYAVRFATGDPAPEPGSTRPDQQLRPIDFEWDYEREPANPSAANGQDYDFKEAIAWRRRQFAERQQRWKEFWEMVRSPGNEQLAQYLDMQQELYASGGLVYEKGMSASERYNLKLLRRDFGIRGLQDEIDPNYVQWRESWSDLRRQQREFNLQYGNLPEQMRPAAPNQIPNRPSLEYSPELRRSIQRARSRQPRFY